MGTRTTVGLPLCSPKNRISRSKLGLSPSSERRLPVGGCPCEQFSRLQETRPKVGKERLFLLPAGLRNVSSAQDCGLCRGAGRKEPWSQRKLDPGSATSELCAKVSYLTSLSLTSTIHNQPTAGRATDEVCKANTSSRNIASCFP